MLKMTHMYISLSNTNTELPETNIVYLVDTAAPITSPAAHDKDFTPSSSPESIRQHLVLHNTKQRKIPLSYWLILTQTC